MKKSVLVICIVIPSSILLYSFSFLFSGPVGKIFPDLTGDTYSGKKITIPKDTKGKFTLLGMAYSNKAEDDLKTWIHPIYNKFIVKHEDKGATDLSYNYDVHLYFIPMFTGLNKLTVEQSKKKIKEDTDSELHPYVVFYEGSLKVYQEQLGINQKELPYFFVLDKNGKIIYSTTGKYTEEKMDAIEELIE